MLQFDANGFLTPYEIIEIPEIDFKIHFIDGLNNSSTRNQRWKEYNYFLEIFTREFNDDFHVWVYGSLVTKKEEPDDIDIILFLSISTFDDLKKKNRIEYYFQNSIYLYNVDLYIGVIPDKNDFGYNEDIKALEHIKKTKVLTNENNPKGAVKISYIRNPS